VRTWRPDGVTASTPGKADYLPLMRISLDGPSGAGKTTTGTTLAHIYHLPVLDTGLTFRAVAVARFEDQDPSLDVHAILQNLRHELAVPDSKGRLVLAGVDITDRLFDPLLDELLTEVSRSAAAKAAIADFHAERITATGDDVLVVGRDASTRLLNDPTDVNIYLTATQAARTARRRQQTEVDATRSPLVRPESDEDRDVRRAVEPRARGLSVDNTHKSFDTTVALLRAWVELTLR
jgi:CMP/dCMP kinase